MNDLVAQGVFGVAVPLSLGAAAAVLAVRHRPDPAPQSPAWLLGAFAMAGIIAFFGLYGMPSEKWQLLAWLPLAGLGAGIPWMRGAAGLPVRLTLALGLGVAITAILWPAVRTDPLIWRLVPGAGTVLLLLAIEPLAHRRPGPSLPIAIGLAIGGAAGIVLLSGSIKFAVPLAACGFAVGAAGLVGLRLRRIGLAGGALLPVVPLLVSVPALRYLYMVAEDGIVPPVAFALPALALPLLWLIEVPPLGARRPVLAGVSRVVLVLLVCGAALLVAAGAGGEEEADDPYADMYRDMLSLRSAPEHP